MGVCAGFESLQGLTLQYRFFNINPFSLRYVTY